MKLRPLLLASVLTWVTLSAHDIITTKLTFTRDISRVFVRRCQSCHGSDSKIPLTTYGESRPWAVAIKEQVLSRQMPPWGAVKGFGHLSPDNSLTQEEIFLIAAWVVGGAPKGDPVFLAPTQPTIPSPLFPTKDALTINSRVILKAPLAIVGIRPITTTPISSARITATFPDGQIQPLLWLSNYQPEWHNTFRFPDTIPLPRGATIQSDSPLNFALQTN